MTPVELLDSLKVFCEDALRELMLPVYSPPNAPETRPPDVYKMRLPKKNMVTEAVPYVLLQVITGEDTQAVGENEESECKIRIVACCYDEDDSEGALQVLNVLTRLRTAFLKQRVIGNKFTLQMPLEWLVYPADEENTGHYHVGEMLTIWEMPIIKREVEF